MSEKLSDIGEWKTTLRGDKILSFLNLRNTLEKFNVWPDRTDNSSEKELSASKIYRVLSFLPIPFPFKTEARCLRNICHLPSGSAKS